MREASNYRNEEERERERESLREPRRMKGFMESILAKETDGLGRRDPGGGSAEGVEYSLRDWACGLIAGQES